jgi:hypothetical protein
LAAATTGNQLANIQTLTISELPCYNANAQPMAGSNIGTQLNGNIWVNYTSTSAAPSPSNPWHTIKAIRFKLSVA